MLLMSAPVQAATTISTFLFTGDCTSCSTPNARVTATLKLQDYTSGTAAIYANFYSLVFNVQNNSYLEGINLNGAQDLPVFTGALSDGLAKQAFSVVAGHAFTPYRWSDDLSTGSDGSFVFKGFSSYRALNTTTGEFVSSSGTATYTGINGFWQRDPREISVQSIVPETASWMMLVTGFGVIGGALRRRRAAVAIVA